MPELDPGRTGDPRKAHFYTLQAVICGELTISDLTGGRSFTSLEMGMAGVGTGAGTGSGAGTASDAGAGGDAGAGAGGVAGADDGADAGGGGGGGTGG